MSKNNLLKEAIADAKNIKEAAVANARLALEETFAPRIKEMLAAKISEMDSESEMEVKEDYNEDGDVQENPELEEDLDLDEILAELEQAEQDEMAESKGKLDSDEMPDEDEMKETIDLDAILAEVENEDEDVVSEAKADDEDKEKPKPKAKPKAKDKDEDETESEDETEEDEEIGEMTIDELKELIQSIISGDSDEDPAEEKPGAPSKGFNTMMQETEVAEGTDPEFSSAVKGAQELAKMLDKGADYVKSNAKAVKSTMDKINKILANVGAAAGDAMRNETENSLAEIDSLRSELNETNLLNAKLLYANKIFRSNTLNESQKLKVINSFDKAKNVKETKLIYETIKDSFKSKDKKNLKESLGFASKPTGYKKNDIIEQPDATVARFQKLAGITKK